MSPASKPAPARRRALGLLVLIYGLALLGGLGLFLAYRVYSRHALFSQREYFWVGDMYQDASMGFEMRPDRDGFAVLNHGLHDPARRVAVRTDEMGCRVPIGADSTALVPGGVCAIGCSCTFGHGVAAESTYVALAGEMLDLPAYNLGVCSYSSVTSLLHLRESIARIRPRWVVYGFGNFHVERSARPRAESDVYQSYARAERDGIHIVAPRFDNRAVFASAARIESLYYLPRLAGEETGFDLQRARVLVPLALQDLGRALHPNMLRIRFERPNLPEPEFLAWLVDEMLATCRGQGAGFALLYFPAFFMEDPAPGLIAAAAAHAGEADFVFVNCAPALFEGVGDQQEYSNRWQVPRDGHPNRFMHLEMARTLVRTLEGANPAPPVVAPAEAPSRR